MNAAMTPEKLRAYAKEQAANMWGNEMPPDPELLAAADAWEADRKRLEDWEGEVVYLLEELVYLAGEVAEGSDMAVEAAVIWARHTAAPAAVVDNSNDMGTIHDTALTEEKP